MKNQRPYSSFFLVLCLVVFTPIFEIAGVVDAIGGAKGVVINDSGNLGDRLAKAIPFVSIQRTPMVTNVTTEDGKEIRLMTTEVKAVADLPNFSADFLTNESFDVLEHQISTLAELSKKYPRSMEILTPIIEKGNAFITMGKEGKCFSKGQWVEKGAWIEEFTLEKKTSKEENVFTTLNGKIYDGAKITRVEPSGIVVMHKSGMVRIPFTELPEEIQKKYGFDAEKAKEFDGNLRKQQNELSLKREEMAKLAEQKAADAIEMKELREKAKKETFYVLQVLNDGALVHPLEERAIGGSMSRIGGGGYVRAVMVPNRRVVYYLRNAPNGLVDEQRLEIVFVDDGSFTYANADGAQITVKAFRVVSREDLGL